MEGASPIAADGGFGPMDYDEGDEEEEQRIDNARQKSAKKEARVEEKEEDNGFGDDFNDFEDGAATEDFGDFDDGLQEVEEEAEEEPPPSPQKPFAPAHSAFVSSTIARINQLPTLHSFITISFRI